MDMRFAEGNKKALFTAGIFIIAMALLFQFIYMPKHKESIRLNKEYAGLKSDIEELYDFIGGRDDLENNIIKIREEFSLLKQAFPSEKSVSDIIKGLNDKAKLFKVNVISLKPKNLEIYRGREGKELKVSDYFCKSMPLVLNVEARYEALGRFLEDLEASRDPMISVKEVKIEKDEDITPALSAEIGLSAYILGK